MLYSNINLVLHFLTCCNQDIKSPMYSLWILDLVNQRQPVPTKSRSGTDTHKKRIGIHVEKLIPWAQWWWSPKPPRQLGMTDASRVFLHYIKKILRRSSCLRLVFSLRDAMTDPPLKSSSIKKIVRRSSWLRFLFSAFKTFCGLAGLTTSRSTRVVS